jgi:predicted  nucleic acid-binding Zn-ribbon protein
MAYQISPRFGSSAFIPPPDVFGDSRRDVAGDQRGIARKRSSEVLNTDPVAMHLLVETAISDSQNFDILAVEEVESLKQEQKTLDARLSTVRKKLESETKIRDATRSLGRLAMKKGVGHTRGLSSKGSNTSGGYDEKSQEGLETSNKRVEAFVRELLEVESRMRMIDMRLLMHTAAVLQLTHKGPSMRSDKPRMSGEVSRRPDSPASLDTYDVGRVNGVRSDDLFDERSFYRSPENLDSLMDVLQNGTLHHSDSTKRPEETITTTAKRLEEMNEKLRTLLAQTTSDGDAERPLPPLPQDETPDASTVDRQLDFLDQALRNFSAEQANMRTKSRHAFSEVEGRLEGINNQLYAMLSRAQNEGAEKATSPPPVIGGDPTEQLNYMEYSFYNLEQIQHSLNEQIGIFQSQAQNSESKDMAEKYETTLMGLWQIIQAGEEEARERKQTRRRALAEDPNADEQLSPDEDYNPNESFSLPAFSAKVQWLFSRATSLKDKQSVLMRQIKQQRELNSKSDAQKEAEFQRLNEQVLSTTSEKQLLEDELERAMHQLEQFDEEKMQADSQALHTIQERNAGLEAQLINMQERAVAFETELQNADKRAIAYENQLKDVQERTVAAHSQLQDAEGRSKTYERDLKDHQERHTTSNLQAQEVQERSGGYEAQLRDAQERAIALESKLREAQDDAHVDAATIEAELAESTAKIDEVTAALTQATAEKEAAEARSLEATNTLNAKVEEFRDLEGKIVRLTTELTFAKAELDGAYGTRAQRAADSAANPAIKRELDELSDRNQALLDELTALRKVHDAASQSEVEARQSERNLKAELSGMASEYEALTRDAIQNERDREVLESQIDKLRDEKEALERELSDEKVKWLGVRSPLMPNGAGQLDMGATSIRMLREDFRKMMRDRTAEGLKALRVSQIELYMTIRS